MTNPEVLVDITDGVAQVTLDAPDRRNALTADMLDQLEAAVATVAADDQVRVMVLTGAGPAFCSGAHVDSLFGDLDRPIGALREQLQGVYAKFLGIRDLEVPTIAAVGGSAVGAGMNMALACDIVVISPTAKLMPSFVEIGLHPGGGASWMFTERVGYHQALRLFLDGAPVPGTRAVGLGLAETVADDPLAHALDLARTYAARDRELTLAIKRSMQHARTSDLATSVEIESWAQAASLGSQRFRDYVDQTRARRS